ncbi:unnamed protein product [Closterium sp. NIES-54]
MVSASKIPLPQSADATTTTAPDGGLGDEVGVVVGVVAGVEVSAAAVEAEEAVAVVEGAEAAEVAEAVEAAVELVAALRRVVAPVAVRASSSSADVRPRPPRSFVSGTLRISECGGLHSTQRCFGRLTDAWRHQFPDATKIPRWGDLSRAGVAIFDLDYDAILAAMYAVSTSDEGDCYLCLPPDPGGEAAALGACEAAALGASASAAPGAGESALSGTASAQVFHTFTLDSGASGSFFRDRITLTLLSRPVVVSLADPSGGLVLASFSTVLPCPAAPSGTQSGLYLPSFSTNLVSGADLQDQGVDQFTPASQRVTHCTCARMGRLLATFTRRPGSSLYTLSTESPPVAALSQVFAAASGSGPESAPCSCRLLSHQTLLWHQRLGHPSLPHLRGMASRVLVSGLTRSLPPLPSGPAPTCVPCVEGRQRAVPHSSEFPSTEAPLQTLHMDVWGPARVRGQGHERYFLLVVEDYSRYTTVFPLHSKCDVTETFTLPASPQQNGIAERRIGMVMDVARTSMIHAAAPHFMWPFAVQYAAHQLNLQPWVSLPETSPTLRWTGKVGDASAFRVWGSRAFVRDLSADKLSPRAVPCVFLGFPPDAPGWQFYHPTSCRVMSSQNVTFDESGLAPSGVSQVDAVKLVEVAVDSGAARGAEPVGAASGGAESGGAEPGGAASGGAESGCAEPGGAEPGGAESARVASCSASSRRELLSPQELREWFAWRWSRAAGAGGPPVATSPGDARTGGTGAVGTGGAAAAAGVGAAGASGAAGAGATGGVGAGVGAACAGAAGGVGAGVGPAGGAAGAAGGTGAAGHAGVGAVGAGGAAGTGAATGGTGAVPVGTGGPARPRPYFVPLLEQVLGLLPSPGPAPPLECPQPVHSQSPLQPVSPLPAPSPYAGPTGGLAERREPASRPASLVLTTRASRRAPRPRPPAVPGTHQMTLRPSIAPLRVPLPSPPESSLPVLADPASDSLRAACPTVARLLSTVVTDPSFESTVASALVAELVDFAARCRLDYAASLVAESASVCPPSVGGECALITDVLEDRQEEFQCFAAALPHLVSTLIAPEGDPDAPDIPTPRSYAEAIEGPYSSQWQSAMDAEMASWKSTGTYVDEVPPPGANIVSGMRIFRVKRPPGSPPVFKARYVARGFTFRQGSLHEIWLRRPPGFTGSFPPGTQWSLRRPVYGLRQAPREWHDTLRTTLTALGFAPSAADPSLFLRTDTSLPPFYILVYVDNLVFATADTSGLAHVKSELQKRHTCTDLGELRSYLGLQITRDRAQRTITLTQSHMVQQVLQRFDFTYSSPQATPLSTRHSLSALPSDESVEPSGPYPELVGCLMYLMTCTQPDLLYPLSILARYVAPGRHRPEHMAAAKKELRWLTYLLTDLGEPPRSPPVLYVDNKAMLALCQEHRLEHRTKHIALRYFLARELQQRGQLRLAYVASEANTADIFTKALAPDVTDLRTFGCTCYYHVPDATRTKLEAKARVAMYLGPSVDHKGWCVWDLEHGKPVVSRDLVFYEDTFPSKSMNVPSVIIVPPPLDAADEADEAPTAPPPSMSEGENGSDVVGVSGDEGNSKESDPSPPPPTITPTLASTRTWRTLHPNFKYDGYSLVAGDDEGGGDAMCLEAYTDTSSTYQGAMSLAEAAEWECVLQEEYDSLIANDVYDLVPMPPGAYPVGSRWDFKKKLGPNGEVERYKARLVGQGYTQKEGLHYNKTFAPAAKSATLRTLLTLAGALDLEVEQLDVKMVLPYGRVKEEVYMKQPPGFDDDSDRVCKLERTIYGIKQSPRAWYTRIDEHLLSLGFVRSECDHALYILNKDEKKPVLLLYFDDLLLVGLQDTCSGREEQARRQILHA